MDLCSGQRQCGWCPCSQHEGPAVSKVEVHICVITYTTLGLEGRKDGAAKQQGEMVRMCKGALCVVGKPRVCRPQISKGPHGCKRESSISTKSPINHHGAQSMLPLDRRHTRRCSHRLLPPMYSTSLHALCQGSIVPEPCLHCARHNSA